MSKFSTDDSLEVSAEAGELSFFLNNLRIKNDAQLKEFMNLCAKLIQLTDGACCLSGELADVSSADIKMLRFDVEADGTYTLEMAAV